MSAPWKIQSLEALLVFSRSRSVAEAAKKLGITQPALSKQLKGLEAQLGRALFAQVGKRKVITPLAEALCRELEGRIGNLHPAILQLMNSHADASNSQIRIAARREILDRLSARLHFKGQVRYLELSH